mmetsp:Transcript_43731/g.138225  ORF Transcript_43731/g.138225 Transcript_43731/m.138225 type:complete len:207 (-) Transcript_43731:507-1127(-)
MSKTYARPLLWATDWSTLARTTSRTPSLNSKSSGTPRASSPTRTSTPARRAYSIMKGRTSSTMIARSHSVSEPADDMATFKSLRSSCRTCCTALPSQRFPFNTLTSISWGSEGMEGTSRVFERSSFQGVRLLRGAIKPVLSNNLLEPTTWEGLFAVALLPPLTAGVPLPLLDVVPLPWFGVTALSAPAFTALPGLVPLTCFLGDGA